MTRAERRHERARIVAMWERRYQRRPKLDALKHASYRGEGCRQRGCKSSFVRIRQMRLDIDAANRAA